MQLFARNNIASESDEKLMLLLARGHQGALEQLYMRYSDKLYGYLLKSMQFDSERAADLLQDIFLKIAEKPHQFNPTKSFKVWIFTIASNMLKNEWRNAATARSKVDELSNTLPSVYDETISDEIDKQWLDEKLQTALLQLTAAQRQLIHLRYVEDCTVPQIAVILEIPEGTVKSRLYHVVKQLSEKLHAPYSLFEK